MATKIYYAPCYHAPVGYIEQNPLDNTDIWDHPLHSEHAFIPPMRMTDYEKGKHEGHSYYDCPAWKSYWANSWVVFNQVDLEIEYDKESGMIQKTNFQNARFRDHILINEGKIMEGGGQVWSSTYIGTPYKGNLVFQMPQLLFMWLPKKEKNIWCELAAHPETFHETGLEYIANEYPFSRWMRPANAAFKAHGSKFKLKRGAPLYTIRFRGGKNNAYSFQRYEKPHPPKELQVRLNQHQALKQWQPGISWNLFKKDEESKCPYKFWK